MLSSHSFKKNRFYFSLPGVSSDPSGLRFAFWTSKHACDIVATMQTKSCAQCEGKKKETQWLLVSMHAVMQKGLAKSFVRQLFNDFANVLRASPTDVVK
jgi:hypothetical protein